MDEPRQTAAGRNSRLRIAPSCMPVATQMVRRTVRRRQLFYAEVIACATAAGFSRTVHDARQAACPREQHSQRDHRERPPGKVGSRSRTRAARTIPASAAAALPSVARKRSHQQRHGAQCGRLPLERQEVKRESARDQQHVSQRSSASDLIVGYHARSRSAIFQKPLLPVSNRSFFRLSTVLRDAQFRLRQTARQQHLCARRNNPQRRRKGSVVRIQA